LSDEELSDEEPNDNEQLRPQNTGELDDEKQGGRRQALRLQNTEGQTFESW
jgi:hypothetical protein